MAVAKLQCGGCGRFDRSAAYVPGDCLACWKWWSDPRLERAFGRCPFGQERTAEQARKVVSLPCVHVGDVLPAGAAAELGLNPARRWHRCGRGYAKNPKSVVGVACPCTGCGPKCEGYESGESND